jgi:septal ring factor EnvC (AmiA/AmiB activator)
MTFHSIRIMTHLTRYGAAALCMFVISCNEDPELVRKHGEQEAEIAKLEGEITLMEERIKYLPPDQSSELAAAEQETRKLEAEQKQLADEVARLEEERDALKQQYEEYRRKYAVR